MTGSICTLVEQFQEIDVPLRHEVSLWQHFEGIYQRFFQSGNLAASMGLFRQ
jgi:hypothetical protein